MASYMSFNEGTDYGFTPKYAESGFLGMGYRTPASQIGISSNPTIANQIAAVNERLNTGVKVVEVSMLNLQSETDALPKQHVEEIRRLKNLVGAELTLHGPLVEPTGITKQGWEDTDRQKAERQMWEVLKKGMLLIDKKDKENMVVTFHASHNLPDFESKEYDEKDKGKGPKITGMMVVDQSNNNFTNVDSKEKHFPTKDGKAWNIKDEIDQKNKENWNKQLQGISYHAFQGQDLLDTALIGGKRKLMQERIEIEQMSNEEKKAEKERWKRMYNDYLKTENLEELKKSNPQNAKIIEENLNDITHAELYIKDAYSELKNRFNEAYETAKENTNSKDNERIKKAKEDLKKLNEFKSEIAPKVKDLEDNPAKIDELADEVIKGIHVLRSIDTPQRYKPLREFAIDKASETFSNVALKAFNESEKLGKKAPIISIENPPAGTGMYRAEELKELIEESQRKFAQKLVQEKNISESEAKKEAQKLIGATWDLGHINMLRQFGYGDDELVKQTQTIAKNIKHVHLSDNFGMKHTELPMGMGNVPTERHMKIINEYAKQAKKIIEAGDWFVQFKTPPIAETLGAFGSPIYASGMSPYWGQIANTYGGYFSGFGMNPDIHHSIYNAGFSSLPVELGGQQPGRGSRFSGNPME
jgi:hypothetical protein